MFPHTFESSKSNQMKSIITAVILFITTAAFAQNTISGKVVDKRKIYCWTNIYIDGTYDGATTNENGQFSFSTTATGNQVLIAFFLFMKLVKQQLMLLISK
jgi:uncharacterized protein with FMN-binding domain